MTISSLTCNLQEDVFSEKELSVNFDVSIYSSISELIYPSDCKTKEEWFEKVKATWNATLKDLEECEEFKACGFPLPGITKEMTHNYPPNNKRAIAVIGCAVAVVAVVVGIIRLLLRI